MIKVLPVLATALICALGSQAAFAQQALDTPKAVALFTKHCLNQLGNHKATNEALAKAKGFTVVDTSGDERILVQSATQSVDMSNLRFNETSVCFVGYTPSESREDAQSQAAAAIVATLGLQADVIKRSGKELRINTSAGLIKIVANRVYPISINVTSPYK